MLTLTSANTFGGVAGTATAITYSIFGMTLNAGVEAFAVLAQGQLPTSAAALYNVPSATSAFIKQVHLANTTGSTVSGIALYVNGTSAAYQISGSFSIPANGTAMLDGDGRLSVYDSNGSLLQSIANQTATNLTGTPTLPNGVAATTQSPLDSSTKLATTAYTDAAVAAYSVAHTTIFQTTVDFGSTPRKSGKFTITGPGWTPGKQVLVVMAASRPVSTLYDAIELDQIMATGIVTSSTTIEVHWGSRTWVSNQYTFNYWLGN